MNIQKLINSRFGTGLALWIGNTTPAWLGYRVANLAARWISSQRNLPMVRAVRANQWVVSGGTLGAESLDEVVLAVFKSNTRALYDFYHNLERPKKSLEMMDFDPDFQRMFDKMKSGQFPAVAIAPHLSNFDLGGRALGQRGLSLQILSIPQPPGGYQWQNRIRQNWGLELTPMSGESVQKARDRLRHGGVVLTGFDRPLGEVKIKPRFFGRSSALPVAYLSLALQTQVPLVIVAVIPNGKGAYQLIGLPPIEVEAKKDRDETLLYNAEKVLAVAEPLIRQYHRSWSMFYPVWPEALEEMP